MSQQAEDIPEKMKRPGFRFTAP